MNDSHVHSHVLTTVPPAPPQPDFTRFNLEAKRIALELLTLSYTKALTFHHTIDFAYPDGPAYPLAQTLSAEIQLACELGWEKKLELISALALSCWQEELAAK